MKKIFMTLILFLGICQSYGQTLTHEDFVSLIPALKEENWKSAFKESTKLLKRSEKDTTEFHSIILYINIFSASGMVSEGQMSYEDLEKNIMKFQGQKVIMPAHPVTTRDGALSQIKFEVNDSTNEAFTSATNAKGTNSLLFVVAELLTRLKQIRTNQKYGFYVFELKTHLREKRIKKSTTA